MIIVEIDKKTIQGVDERTTNVNEKNQDSAKIKPLWDSFQSEISVHLADDAEIFGVYYDYESDANGAFNILAGSNKIKSSPKKPLKQVTIQAGKYMVFHAEGSMPEMVIDAWEKIRDYFLLCGMPYQRKYTTDFECYTSQQEVDIHIAIY